MPTVVPLRRNGEIEALALFYTSQQAKVSEADLRAELARQLPAYLVPSRIRRLDRLPVLANGKLDRQLLETIIAGTTGSAADGRT
jgi:acyl-CoA synthetase (AMP-forming)/AMP-acid ligase II